VTESNGKEAVVREVLREVLEELLPRMGAAASNRRESAEPAPETPHGGPPVPLVPSPPIASVHRPSTWVEPDAAQAKRVEASSEPARHEDGNAKVEEVVIESDADLEAFARRLLQLYENPRDRQALRAGKLCFALRRAPGRADAAASSAPAVRIEKGAVTERAVNEAAAAGSRLVLGPRAVLTPMARDRAKKLHIEIEREARC
jgi:hypothetical protein